MSPERYYWTSAAAFVRGRQRQGEAVDLPASFQNTPLGELTSDQLEAIWQAGVAAELKLHKFKRTMGLPRVERVLGALRSLAPAELLDLGSGRGVFLWPLLDAFPDLPVTAVDADPRRARDLAAVRLGGQTQLTSCQADVIALPFANDQFDTVSLLEVLEHIPRCADALAEVVRVARRFVILSVPAKPDDNPEHIHLFSVDRLQSMFAALGVERVSFASVRGHLVAIANVSTE